MLVPDIATWLPRKVIDTGVDWMQVARALGYAGAVLAAAGLLIRFAAKSSAPAK